MELEHEAYYWALAYGELVVVQYDEDGVFWMIGDENSDSSDNIKIIAKITPPDPADDKTIAQFLRNAD